MTGLELLRLVIGLLGGNEAQPTTDEVDQLVRRADLDEENARTLHDVARRMRGETPT